MIMFVTDKSGIAKTSRKIARTLATVYERSHNSDDADKTTERMSEFSEKEIDPAMEHL